MNKITKEVLSHENFYFRALLAGDPFHSGHREIIEYLSKNFDIVVVVPTNIKYYKNYKGRDRAMFSFTERFDRIREKCQDLKNVKVSDIERDIPEGWRFYDTLKFIINTFGDKNEFYIAIGSDSLINFKTWYKWQEILEISKLVVFTRPGYTKDLPKDLQYEIVQMNNGASSTQIRKELIDYMENQR